MVRNAGSMTPSEQQSQELLEESLRQALTGDEDAFVQLYRHLHAGVLRYVAALVGPDAEDVTAETWLQVARDLHSFRGDLAGFRGWVVTIARHRALDQLRARARRPVTLDDLTALTERPAGDDTAAEALTRLHTARAVALVATLPREMAEAVLLRAVVGLDVATTARVLGKRPTAVRAASHRGLKRLAEQLRRDRAPAPGDARGPDPGDGTPTRRDDSGGAHAPE